MTVLSLARRLLFILALAALMPVGAAHADAISFLKGLEGNWRGGGTLRGGRGNRATRVRCTMRNNFAANLRRLTLGGRCASAQGTRPVRGALTASRNGRRVSGSAFRSVPGARVVSTSTSFRGNRLTISSRLVDRQGRNVRTRATISGGGRSYRVSVSANDGSGWKSAGSLSFRR